MATYKRKNSSNSATKSASASSKGRPSLGSASRASRESKASLSKIATWQCLTCDETCFEDDDCRSIECFVCKKWSHQSCAELQDEVFDLLNNPFIQWTCRTCTEAKKGPQTKTEEKLDLLTELIVTLQARFDNLEKEIIGDQLEQKIENMVDKKVAEAMYEMEQKEKRKENIIIVNLKESSKTEAEERKQEDLDEAKKLIQKITSIEEDEVSEPIRLGKVGGNRPRMLKVKIGSVEKKKEILRNAHTLNKDIKDIKHKIYINPDLTQNERSKQRELREEKRIRTEKGEKDLVIKGGKVVKKINTYLPQDEDLPGQKIQPEQKGTNKSPNRK